MATHQQRDLAATLQEDNQDCPEPKGCWWQQDDIVRAVMNFLPNRDVLLCDLVCVHWRKVQVCIVCARTRLYLPSPACQYLAGLCPSISRHSMLQNRSYWLRNRSYWSCHDGICALRSNISLLPAARALATARGSI